MNLFDDVSYVKRGKNRQTVLRALEGALMPSELVVKIYSKSSNTRFNIVSRALSELVGKKLAKIVNPKSRTGRLYMLTDKGKKVAKMLEK